MVTIVNSAAGTVLIKAGSGKLYDVVGISTGTSYAFICKDGPDSAGNFRVIYGGAAIPVVAGQHLIVDSREVAFRDGLSFTVSGTAGEFEVHFD